MQSSRTCALMMMGHLLIGWKMEPKYALTVPERSIASLRVAAFPNRDFFLPANFPRSRRATKFRAMTTSSYRRLVRISTATDSYLR